MELDDVKNDACKVEKAIFDGFQESVNVLAQQLLDPINDIDPCGQNIEYESDYFMLQSRLVAQPEVQYGDFIESPKAIDWHDIERECLRLLRKSKDINIAIWLLRCRCRIAGINGFVEGIEFLLLLLEKYPVDIHPQLVLEGLNEPAVRANAMAALVDPGGLLGDLRETFIDKNVAKMLSIGDVERSFAMPKLVNSKDQEVVKRQLVEMYLQNDERVLSLAKAKNILKGIEKWANENLADCSVNFSSMRKILDNFSEQKYLSGDKLNKNKFIQPESEPFWGQNSSEMKVDSNFNGESSSVHASTSFSPFNLDLNSQLINREKVKSHIHSIRIWFEYNEPSSPVGLLLKQAENMIGKKFTEITHVIPQELLQLWDREIDS